MKENFEINATPRSKQGTSASRRLRHAGMVPGIVYGGDTPPEMFTVSHNALIQHLENDAFYSSILTVNIDGKKQQVVLKDIQRHPAKPFIQHLDLLRVADTGQIKMHIPLRFVNEDSAPGVKAGGKISRVINDVEIICAAKDLPEFIAVDVAEMQIGDAIHLSALELPEGVEILALTQGSQQNPVVVTVNKPQVSSDEADEEADQSTDT